MRKTLFFYTILTIGLGIFGAAEAAAQDKNSWAGEWRVASRYAPSILTIRPAAAGKFDFTLEALNGANTGEISGSAEIRGGRAVFDDRKSSGSDDEKYGCLLTFTNKGASIEVEQNEKCSSYGGVGVVFEGDYKKGKAAKFPANFVERELFPTAELDRKFRDLTGGDYEIFLDAFQQDNPEEDLDRLGATVHAACVRGICPWLAAVVMFDRQGNLWAAVLDVDDNQKTSVRYYTNVAGWADKLPKTIEKWVAEKRDLNENLTVVFKNKDRAGGGPTEKNRLIAREVLISNDGSWFNFWRPQAKNYEQGG